MLVEDAAVDTSGSGAAEPQIARRFQRARVAVVQRGCPPRGRQAGAQSAGVRARARPARLFVVHVYPLRRSRLFVDGGFFLSREEHPLARRARRLLLLDALERARDGRHLPRGRARVQRGRNRLGKRVETRADLRVARAARNPRRGLRRRGRRGGFFFRRNRFRRGGRRSRDRAERLFRGGVGGSRSVITRRRGFRLVMFNEFVPPVAPVAPVDESRAQPYERLGVRRRARLGARPGFVFHAQSFVERLEQHALELGGVQRRVHRRLGSGRVVRERLSE